MVEELGNCIVKKYQGYEASPHRTFKNHIACNSDVFLILYNEQVLYVRFSKQFRIIKHTLLIPNKFFNYLINLGNSSRIKFYLNCGQTSISQISLS